MSLCWCPMGVKPHIRNSGGRRCWKEEKTRGARVVPIPPTVPTWSRGMSYDVLTDQLADGYYEWPD